MNKEKINAFKKDLKDLLEKYNAIIDVTRDDNDYPCLKVFMKYHSRGFYEILYFPDNIIDPDLPELEII